MYNFISIEELEKRLEALVKDYRMVILSIIFDHPGKN